MRFLIAADAHTVSWMRTANRPSHGLKQGDFGNFQEKDYFTHKSNSPLY